MPPLAQKCIASWRKYLPDYEIKEWNEDNFDVDIIPYTAEAYRAKKYAFVSDYARFWILYKYGGIYFDTDVEVIRPLDDIIVKGCFMGFETDPRPKADGDGLRRGTDKGDAHSGTVAPGLGLGVNPGLGLGVNPGLGLMKKMLDYYDGLHFVNEAVMRNQITVVHIATKILMDNGLRNVTGVQRLGNDVYIYPAEYFCPINVTTGRLHVGRNTRTIHHYAGTWAPHTSSSFKDRLKKILPEWVVILIIRLKSKIK